MKMFAAFLTIMIHTLPVEASEKSEVRMALAEAKGKCAHTALWAAEATFNYDEINLSDNIIKVLTLTSSSMADATAEEKIAFVRKTTAAGQDDKAKNLKEKSQRGAREEKILAEGMERLLNQCLKFIEEVSPLEENLKNISEASR